MNLLIVMNGHCACLKTFLSKRMQRLGFVRLTTSGCKGNIFETKEFDLVRRGARYNEMLEAAEPVLKSGKSLVLDATFIKRNWRKKAYKLAKKYSYNVLVLRCICSSSKLVKKRMDSRKGSTNVEDEAKDFFRYKQLLEEDESPVMDVELVKGLISLIVFDTVNLKIVFRSGSKKLLFVGEFVLNNCLKGVEVNA